MTDSRTPRALAASALLSLSLSSAVQAAEPAPAARPAFLLVGSASSS